MTGCPHPAGRPGRPPRSHPLAWLQEPEAAHHFGQRRDDLPQRGQGLVDVGSLLQGDGQDVRTPRVPPAQRHPRGRPCWALGAWAAAGSGPHVSSAPRESWQRLTRAARWLPGPLPPHQALREANAFLTPKTAGPRRWPLRTLASRPHCHLATVSSVGKAAEGLAYPPGRPLAAGRSCPCTGPWSKPSSGKDPAGLALSLP